MKLNYTIRTAIGGIVIAVFFSCSPKSENPVAIGNQQAAIVETANETFIFDRTGKQWDITYARYKYSMEPEHFEFGLGQNAILPVMQPILIAQGEPEYPTNDATFPVIATEIEGDARAYRFDKISTAEVVNETIANKKVAVAYCHLVDLAAGYPRKVEGQTLTFAASGWTYRRTFVLYDHQTESLWYHIKGTDGLTCIEGFYQNTFLESFDTFKTRWNEWLKLHKQSMIMSNASR